jgi:PAS domain S-box-containing protein
MLKIMIVDDDFLICEELQGIVLDLEYELTGVADSGEAAVEMALDIKPDVILMDIVMDNGMDGIAAAEEILKSVDCVVIFVTGYGEEEIFERAKQVKPHGYVLKPYTPMEIKSAIEIGFHKKEIQNRLKEAYDNVLTDLKNRTSELETSNHQLETLIQAPTDSMLLLDPDGTILAANTVAAKRHGLNVNEFVGKCAFDLLTKKLAKTRKANLAKVVKAKKPARFVDQRGKIVFDNSVYPIFDNDRNVIQLAIYAKDITKQVESIKLLKEGKRELEKKTELLEQANMALKIMLQKSSENREDIKEEILLLLKNRISPYVSKLKRYELDQKAKDCVEVIETNIEDIVSPFSQNLDFAYVNLSPKEVQIANHIKQNKSTKEIAKILNLAKGTVDVHRNNIREKLDLKNKSISLKTYLLSLH